MRHASLACSLLLLVAGCAQVQGYGVVALQHRRTVNDLQARATMAATRDIALGAHFRELSPVERQYPGLVCGGQHPEPIDPRLVPLTAPEP
jgi:hypothetical protein